MIDDLNRPGPGLPMFSRVCFSPDEATGGATEEVDHAAAARDALASGLKGAGDEGTNAENTGENTSAEIVPPSPAAPPARNWEKEFNDYQAGEPKRRLEAENAALERFARSSPEAWRQVTGQEPPPGQFPDHRPAGEQPSTEATDPNAESNKRIEALEKRDRDREAQAKARELQGQLFEEFDRHEEVFSSEKSGIAQWAQREAADAVRAEMRAGRQPDMRKIVDDIAKAYREHDEKRKATYIDGKRTASERVIPGAGSGGAPPPGKKPEKLKIGKGPGTYRGILDAELAGVGKGKDD